MVKLKKLSTVIYISIVILILTGCSPAVSETGEDKDNERISSEEIQNKNVPEMSKIKNICELSTLRCYYHNVAKSRKKSGTGIFHFGERERIFWMEYTGIVEISFDSERIKMETDGTKIILTLPPPRVICTVEQDSWNEDSYVISEDQWFQKNPITAADQTAAIEEAQTKMKKEVENNSTLLNTAKQQARELIENYINQIGNAAGVEYRVVWKENAADKDS